MNWYMSVYAGIIGLILASSLLRSVTVTRVAIRAGRQIHDALLAANLRCTMRYFDTTPAGRILNMFSKDLDEGEWLKNLVDLGEDGIARGSHL